MIPHHAGAVTMANEALQKSGHPEIKTLSGNIIKAQEAEIKMMNDWKAKWEKWIVGNIDYFSKGIFFIYVWKRTYKQGLIS